MKFKVCVLSVFLSVLLLFSSFSVKANDFAFPAFPEPVEEISSTHYLIIFDSVNDSYELIKPLDPQNMYVTNESDKLVLNFTGSAIWYSWKVGSSDRWVKNLEMGGPTLRKLNLNGYNEGTQMFLYSSFDLYYSDDTLFFQRAPIRESFLAQMKKIQMGAALTTLVSLVPLLTVLVISFLAFRKALAWLLKVLRKA